MIARYSVHVTFFVRKILFYCFRIFPIKKNKIVYSNFGGKGYGDNPKYIYESIKHINGIDHVWLVEDTGVALPFGLRKIKYGRLREIFELATAKVWIDNCRKPIYTRKRNIQYYIQTWHACVSGKRVEADTVIPLPQSWIKTSKNDSKMINVFISDSSFCTKLYSKSFWYDGEIAEIGYPRNDILITEKEGIKTRVYKELGLDEDNKICLYAPTFRVSSNKNLQSLQLDTHMLQVTLEKKFGGRWIILVRLHPIVSSLSEKMNIQGDVIDCTSYPDMYELLSIADIEITDYSSSIFEFACLRKKPAFIFATDIDDYIKERGFYFNIRTLPFGLGESNEELFARIEEFNKEQYFKKLEKFNEEIQWRENGNAAKSIAELILNKLEIRNK